ncbi:tRNA (guanine(37)-N1)-methyltransferase, variant 2 [Dermatophagoides farinae]|uniref:tRNA (Guanine(37)-N1)-methyltransferase, variant 2 n=1 Tax=Dermatophagoides farinae TaxID=6954 RepID=A0A922IBL1_DERFA|nr:tRNA (guanine(37)-N1)-methyltransferase, variant 2 [Dermatophagoides farinae]
MSKKFPKNNRSTNSGGGSKSNNKSRSNSSNNFFKVDPKRAIKAKKNKANVKYKNEMNHQAVVELNRNLDYIRKNRNSFEKIQKPEKTFINPMAIYNTNENNHQSSSSSKTANDLNDAIDRLSNLSSMACMDFSFDSRIRKKYVPLINQQRYLRHVKRIAARNLFIPEPLLRSKLRLFGENNDNIVDDNAEDETRLYSSLNISFYYTIHYPFIRECPNHHQSDPSSRLTNEIHCDCNCGRLLYRSEFLMNNNPSWKGLDGSSLCSPSISQFIVRVYFVRMDQIPSSRLIRNLTNKIKDHHDHQCQEKYETDDEIGTLFLEWNVNLTGLLYIGEEFPKDRRLTRNSIIFGFAEGFYTSVCSVANETLLTHSMPPSESLQITDFHITRDSYCLNTLIRIQMVQCIMQATATQSQLEKSSLEDELMKFRQKQELQSDIERMKTSIEFLTIIAERRRKRLQKLQQEMATIEEKLCEYNMDMSSNVQLLKQELSLLSELRSIKLPETVRKLSQIRSALVYHRKSLARKFFSHIYPIVPFPDGNGYSINCIHLPSAQQMDHHQLKMISIGLGYVAHLVYYLSIVLDVFLFHQIIPFGSNSSILDLYNRLLPPNDRIVPLYPKSRSNLNIKFFKHGWHLLNRNIVFLRQSMGIDDSIDLALTLCNLYSLYRKRFAYDNYNDDNDDDHQNNDDNDCHFTNDDTMNRFNTYSPSIIVDSSRSNSQRLHSLHHDNDVRFDLDDEKLLRNINEVKINDIMIDTLWKEVEQMTLQSMKMNSQSTSKKQQSRNSQQQPPSTSAMVAIVEEQIKDIIIKQRQQKRQQNSELLSQLSSSLSFSRASSSFDILTPNSIRSSVISTSSPQEILRHQRRRFSTTNQPTLSSSFGSNGSGVVGDHHHHHNNSLSSSSSSSSTFRINTGHHCASSLLFQQFHSIRRIQNQQNQQQASASNNNNIISIGPQSLPSSMNHSFLHPTKTTTTVTRTIPQSSSSSSSVFNNNLSFSLDNGLHNLIGRNHHRLSIDDHHIHHRRQFDSISIVHDDDQNIVDDDGITFLMDRNSKLLHNNHQQQQPERQEIDRTIHNNDDHST